MCTTCGCSSPDREAAASSPGHGHGLAELDPPQGALVFVENVANLVCPALFALGERAVVVIASVTEGEDEPIEYPTSSVPRTSSC